MLTERHFQDCAVIFDFDGTLADTLEDVRIIVNSMAEKYHYRVVEKHELEQLRSHTLNSLIKFLGMRYIHVPLVLAEGLKKFKDHVASLPLIDNIVPALRQIRQQVGTTGILTSNSADNIADFLRLHQISELFDFTKATSRLTGKERHLKALIKQRKLDKNRVIYVGDEVRDLEAAAHAGVRSIAVSWGYNNAETLQKAQPHALVHTPQQLWPVIEALLKQNAR